MNVQEKKRDKTVQNPYKMPRTIFDSYAYHQHKRYCTSKGEIKSYMRCKLHSKGCPGKGILDESSNTFIMTHRHSDVCKDPFRREEADFRQGLYTKTRAQPGTLKEIYDVEAKNKVAAAQLLGYPKMKSVMTNWRKGPQPLLPKHIADLAECLQSDIWTDELTYQLSYVNRDAGAIQTTAHTIESYGVQIRKKENFDAHVVFGCTTFAAELKDAKVAFIDATFNVVPNISGATQLLNVMVEHSGQYFPISFALMSKKTEEAYAAVLQCMVQFVMPFFKPEIIVTDFEAALQNAVTKIFPEAQQQGCYFHHKQALLKRRRSKSSMIQIMDHFPHLIEEAYAFERNLMNLCLLPPQFIPEAFEMIDQDLEMQHPELAIIFSDLRHYYKRFWIRGKGTALYSQYKRKIRTNNPIERWHRKFKAAAATKPEVFRFMRVLKELVESAHLDLLTLKQGVLPHRKRSRITEQRETALSRAWERLGNLAACRKDERHRRFRIFLAEVALQMRDIQTETDGLEDYEEIVDIANLRPTDNSSYDQK